MSVKFGVILPAAGSGTRFGEDKLMFDLLGKPVLWHTLRAFEASSTVSSIVVVTRRESLCFVREMAASFSKVVAVVEGGKTRRESVRKGLEALPVTDFVSVHDAARPLILPEEIDRIHRSAQRYGSVCAAFPVYDTVQQVDKDGYIVATPDRESLVAAATPQVFPYAVYRAACDAEGDFTDDAGMVSAIGERVKTVICRGENFKITTKEDALRAKQILLSRREDGISEG